MDAEITADLTAGADAYIVGLDVFRELEKDLTAQGQWYIVAGMDARDLNDACTFDNHLFCCDSVIAAQLAAGNVQVHAMLAELTEALS